MRKIIFSVLILVLSLIPVYASDDYTKHSTPEDCYVRFENSVYDLTDYLEKHDKFMDIRSWCGDDMTEDFKNKADAGRDHKEFSYGLLEEYKVYDIEESQAPFAQDAEEEIPWVDMVLNPNPYNIMAPVILSLSLYWIPLVIIKVKNLGKYMDEFNAFWNTVLMLTLIIPSFGFGLFMILRYRFTDLYNIDFDFMYWHVELSLVMGAIAISHLIQRFNLYVMQIKKD